MDKQKRQAIAQMVLAAIMCAAVVIPGMLAVKAATLMLKDLMSHKKSHHRQISRSCN